MNIKCNICGGDVTLSADKTFATCEYCGSTITVPKVSDEQRAAAFNRGNHFRRIGEFDKALASYERILRDDDTDAEAHWCAALCRFGIEYVEDPATYEWIPTCHRASFDSFTEDVDFKAALEYSDGLTRRLYQKEAAKIAEVQKGILATSQNEEPYDVFLCYKETGEDGQRTRDSILAQDIYYQLTDQGHRVFFSRVTLEDKAGSEYEPYIFAALNSAKVMVAVGTKPEHFSAVWVKNEWSRFLALMRKDRSRVLLPCYRDMDPYDQPEQLAVLQSYDMGKIGFIQDLNHGVDKVVKAGKAVPAAVVQQVQETVQAVGSNAEALMERGFMALEDQEWQKADQFFEDALNQNARFAKAYLGKFLAKNHAISQADLSIVCVARTDNATIRRKEACPRNVEIENKAVQQFTVPGLLNATAIRTVFAFDRTYESISESRKKQLDEMRQLWNGDKNLTRAEQFGDAQLKEEIEKNRNSMLAVLEDRLVSAQKTDSNSIADVTRDYAQKIEDAFDYVRRLSQQKLEEKRQQEEQRREAERRREEERREAQRKYEEQQRMQEEKRLREIKKQSYDKAENLLKQINQAVGYENVLAYLKYAAELFDSIGDYLDAPKRSEQCRRRYQQLQRKMNDCCQYCGGEFKGLMTRKCRQCGKPKDY